MRAAHPLCGAEDLVYAAKPLSFDLSTPEVTCDVNPRWVEFDIPIQSEFFRLNLKVILLPILNDA